VFCFRLTQLLSGKLDTESSLDVFGYGVMLPPLCCGLQPSSVEVFLSLKKQSF
jgi:hypothetical protein